MGIGVAAGESNGKVRTDPIINAHGKAAGGQIVAACIKGVIYIGELAQTCGKNSPAVFRDRRKDHWRWATLGIRSTLFSKTLLKRRFAATDGKSRRTKAATAGADVLQAPLQIRGLHIGKRDADNEDGGQLLGGNQNKILA